MNKLTDNLLRGPSADPDIYVAPGVVIVGRVVAGKGCSFWYNTVLRGDVNEIIVGERTNLQDGVIVHVTKNDPVRIGSGVTIGHGAKIHGCTIRDDVLIGIGAIILDGAVIGKNCIIAAGTLIPPRKVIPEGSMVMGSPGKITRLLTPEDTEWIKRNADNYTAYKSVYLANGF